MLELLSSLWSMSAYLNASLGVQWVAEMTQGAGLKKKVSKRVGFKGRNKNIAPHNNCQGRRVMGGVRVGGGCVPDCYLRAQLLVRLVIGSCPSFLLGVLKEENSRVRENCGLPEREKHVGFEAGSTETPNISSWVEAFDVHHSIKPNGVFVSVSGDCATKVKWPLTTVWVIFPQPAAAAASRAGTLTKQVWNLENSPPPTTTAI